MGLEDWRDRRLLMSVATSKRNVDLLLFVGNSWHMLGQKSQASFVASG